MKYLDAGKLVKWETCKFWDLFTVVLNLLRRKVGIHNFLQFIYSGRIRLSLNGTRLELSRYVGYAVEQEDDEEQAVNVQ